MVRPVNKYQEERDERQKMGGVWFTDVRVEVFEEGVKAGRKWGHEEKDEEWREVIRNLLTIPHEERFVMSGWLLIAVDQLEALL